jgi:hypothetical protein
MLYDIQPEIDIEGFEVRDYCHIILKAGENSSEDDVLKWLEDDEGDSDCQTLTE